MNNLINLTDFETFVKYGPVNEGLGDGTQTICNKKFIEGGPITFADGSSVLPQQIVNVVNEAIAELSEQFTKTFEFGENINIIFLAHSSIYKTMAVDNNMNMYMNAGFIYHTLQMNKRYIEAVIMHEMLHVLFDHIERGKNWISAQGLGVNNALWHDTNLAADIEVNQTLVRLHIITEEELTGIIHGMYLMNADGQRGSSTNVVPMETILNNEDYMKKLRQMCPPEPDVENGSQDKIKTSDEWNKGYKDGWNKIAEIIKKYGPKEAWNVLLGAGLINGAGELDLEGKDIADIMAIQFLQVKDFDEYVNDSINESIDIKKEDDGQTYEDGFVKGMTKLLGNLKSSLDGQSGESGPSGSGGPQYDTDLTDEDLDSVDLPMPDNNNDSDESDDTGLPQNIKNSTMSNSKSSGSGKGGSGKPDKDITEDDLNKLANDMENRANAKKNGDNSEGINGASGDESGEDGDVFGRGQSGTEKDKKSDSKNGSGNGSESGDESGEDGDASGQGQSGDEKGKPSDSKNGSGNGSESGDESNDENGQSGSSSGGQRGGNKFGKGMTSAGNGEGQELNGNSHSGENGSVEMSSKPKGDPTAVGGTGSFMPGDAGDEILKDAGYTQEQIDAINKVREENKARNTKDAKEELRQILKSSLKPGFLKSALEDVEVEAKKYRNVWKDILKKFMKKQSRRAGTKMYDGNIKWGKNSTMAVGMMTPRYTKVDQEPQDVNIYVDVSGSVDIELLEVISKSLLILAKDNQYSAINIGPWASTSNGIYTIKDFNKKNDSVILQEILQIVSKGVEQCGGGTDSNALISSMISLIDETLANPLKKNLKDDVHIVITDGYFDYQGLESKLTAAIKGFTKKNDVANKLPGRTFWMIYDAPEDHKRAWENEIKQGTTVFIRSDVVKNNK